jgi:hypothetical protein
VTERTGESEIEYDEGVSGNEDCFALRWDSFRHPLPGFGVERLSWPRASADAPHRAKHPSSPGGGWKCRNSRTVQTLPERHSILSLHLDHCFTDGDVTVGIVDPKCNGVLARCERPCFDLEFFRFGIHDPINGKHCLPFLAIS